MGTYFMKRKIFISINIPEKFRKRLVKATTVWQPLPIKWTKEKNLHITIDFLGHVSDNLIAGICEKVHDTVRNSEIFDLEFDSIMLGPTKEQSRMIWLSGKISEEMRILQEQIEKSLDIFVASKKTFRPHITLGRIRKNKWEALKESPKIEVKFPLIVSVESVEVMASDFTDDGPEYTIIKSCPLS
ncbi:MAG: RNA 2',3'-cyclic phosphodiesterase [Candidatus Moranbacteria bacterium CG_4_9_14_3_um_filter_42_9]|nr:MAG: RNA 2',3'-cyclic phosphodiesterase [Candidatus Moranbacteria bacterium CG_4_9_14_3_um_filter_42_9]